MRATHEQLDFHHGPGFGDHGSRVAMLATALGRQLRLSEKEVDLLRFAAFVHDIGKTQVDPAILAKESALADIELAEVRQHPQVGHDQLTEIVHPSVAEAVLCHHERWDGTGYPSGLRENNIPLFSRIIFVADAFDVMTSGREYRSRLTAQQAGKELVLSGARQFDRRVVDAFASLDRGVLDFHAGIGATHPGLFH
jgi:HD-GYP domain-containing protein (c-di-GMP phosphodiesterase class II)